LPQQTTRAGNIGFISQSGGHNSLFIETATSQGLYFSKAVSVGNALDLGTNDFLEYLGDDPDTQIIGIYVEGMTDGQGRRFFELVDKISSQKPVMLMKAGRGEAGTRAAASHTGSMAGSYALWESMAKQTNAVMVNDYTEMADFIWAYKCVESWTHPAAAESADPETDT